MFAQTSSHFVSLCFPNPMCRVSWTFSVTSCPVLSLVQIINIAVYLTRIYKRDFTTVKSNFQPLFISLHSHLQCVLSLYCHKLSCPWFCPKYDLDPRHCCISDLDDSFPSLKITELQKSKPVDNSIPADRWVATGVLQLLTLPGSCFWAAHCLLWAAECCQLTAGYC